MSISESRFDLAQATRVPQPDGQTTKFEIFIAEGFNGFEAMAVTETLSLANQIVARDQFSWRFVSDNPGLISGANGCLLRAEPAVDNHNLADVMVVVGGAKASLAGWRGRLRQMQRSALRPVLLSDAATTYIQQTNAPSGQVTTHWCDAVQLHETGHYPALSDALSESSDGIITAAGGGATTELVIGLIAPLLSPTQVAELGNRLLLPLIRKSDAAQPKDIADNPSLFDKRVTQAIKIMEDNIAEPMAMTELTRYVGVSSRHLEREFRTVFDQSPARFYKGLRTKRARAMIDETLLPLADVAVATGFGSCSGLSKAIKDAYGVTPAKMRARRSVDLLTFA